MSSGHLVRGSVKLDTLEDPVKLDVKTDLVGIKKKTKNKQKPVLLLSGHPRF